MYAIVSTGGKQYKVACDDVIEVEKLPADAGDMVALDVLLLSDGKGIVTDAAALAEQKVTAEVLEQFKGEKQLVFKFKKRKGYKRLRGHRQNLTRIKIVSIGGKFAPEKKDAAKEETVVEVETKDAPAAEDAAGTDE